MSVVIPSLRGAIAVPEWAKNELWRKAVAPPSLDLRFADSKSLVDATTGSNLVTFTRASSGTFVGSDGVLRTAVTDAPRFDHNPTTGESLGLLVEEQRTNLLLRSEEFETTWTLTQLLAFGSGSVTNATTAPNGTLTADRITENTATAPRFINQGVSGIPASSVITASCYVKFDSANRNFSLQITDAPSGGSGYAELYLTQGGVVTAPTPSSFTNRTATVENVGRGWYRVRLTITTAAVTTITTRLFIVSSANAQNYTGDGTSGLYLWGAQLEAGAFPTSYIPTTAATVTRSADVASITGSAFSSWYRQDEGTLFSDARYNTVAGNTGIASVYNSGSPANNRHSIRIGNTLTTSGGTQVAGFFQYPVLQAIAKYAYGYATDNFCQVLNSTTIAVDTSGALPVGVNAMDIGKVENASFQSNGTIRRLTYWPTRLSNSTLQTLTQ